MIAIVPPTTQVGHPIPRPASAAPGSTAWSHSVLTAPSEHAQPANVTVYRIRISENGLPPNTTWRATVEGITKHTNASLNTFFVPNGTYAFSVGGISGYSISPQFGNVSVRGANVSVGVVFSTGGPDKPLIGGLSLLDLIGIGLLVAIVVGALAFFFVHRRRSPPPPPPPEWTPPGEQPPAPSDPAPDAPAPTVAGAPPAPEAAPEVEP
jgi:hypothetical protein